MEDFKICIREELSPHQEAKASLEVQLEIMKELRIYQAQAMELYAELGSFQDIALKNTTKVADLIIRGLSTSALQDPSSPVSTKAIQRTIRELVCNLTSDIFTRFEGPQLEFNTILQSRLRVVLDTIKKHFKDQEQLNAAKAVHRTVAVHQLNLTNTHLTKTWDCAKEITHDLSSLLNQLEGIVDAILTPTPVMLTSPPVDNDILSPQVSPYKRLRTHMPKELPSALVDVRRLTPENLLASRLLLEAQNASVRIKQTLLDANLTLNLMQGQNQSEDGDIEMPTVTYQDEEVPLTSTSKPTGSRTPPSPPLAPQPPAPCPLPFHAIHPKHVNCVRHLSPQVISKTENMNNLRTWLNHIPTPPTPPCPTSTLPVEPTLQRLRFDKWVSELSVENKRRLDAEQCFGCGQTGHKLHICPTMAYKRTQRKVTFYDLQRHIKHSKETRGKQRRSVE
jgi:hypothetical protein